MEDSTMKKTYIIPNTEVFTIATQQMIASSVNATITATTETNENALSRRNNFWDDEEEEY